MNYEKKIKLYRIIRFKIFWDKNFRKINKFNNFRDIFIVFNKKINYKIKGYKIFYKF